MPLLGADIPDAELRLIDMSCEVLEEFARWWNEYSAPGTTTVTPELGRWMFNNSPDLGDAMRELTKHLSDTPSCGEGCIVAVRT